MNPLLKSLALSVQRAANGYDTLAKGDDRQFANSSACPVFIVGAPRTGSTLLYQLLIKHTRLVFISNLMALVPKKMILIARLTRRQMQQIEDIKESNYGYVPGLFYPNEAGAIMRKWFEQAVSAEEQRLIKNTVVSLSEIFKSPFINKNLLNSLRLQHIHQILPEARFIYIRRNPLFTAQSIFLARRKALDDEQDWLGPLPVGYQEVQAQPPLYQSLWQVKKVDDAVSGFLSQFKPICVEITYEMLCQEPRSTIKHIVDQFQLVSKDNNSLPDPLSISDEIKLSQAEWDRLLQYHSMLYECD